MKKIIKVIILPFKILYELYESGLSNQDYILSKKRIKNYLNK